MSRCFPYPPPGYYAKGERNDALIESSIKLQREKEKAKAERKKESYREKKEKKRRESKVKDISEFGHGDEKKRKRKRKHKDEKKDHKGEKDRVNLEDKYIQKTREDESEQLERSDLTEERGQPVCLQNPCYSSDSTENSNKRRRHTSPATGIRRTHGNILRIRLPSLKLTEPDASVNEEKLCSSSKPIQEELCSTETDVCRRDKEQICSTSGETRNFTQDNPCTVLGSTSKNGIPTVESVFKDLVENWVSPPIQTERTDLDEELEWLFERKHPNRERAKASSHVLCSTGSANLWPRAQFLPEADLYALPFTVPF